MHSGNHCYVASEPISVRSSTNSNQNWDQRQLSLNFSKRKFWISSLKTKWPFQRSSLTKSPFSNLKRCYLLTLLNKTSRLQLEISKRRVFQIFLRSTYVSFMRIACRRESLSLKNRLFKYSGQCLYKQPLTLALRFSKTSGMVQLMEEDVLKL
jgi:hypothetical protein